MMCLKFQEGKKKSFTQRGFETESSYIYLDHLRRNMVQLHKANSSSLLL